MYVCLSHTSHKVNSDLKHHELSQASRGAKRHWVCVHVWAWVIQRLISIEWVIWKFEIQSDSRGGSKRVCADTLSRGHVGAWDSALSTLCCSVVLCGAVCCSAVQCVAVRCSVLQCVAVFCSVLQFEHGPVFSELWVVVCCSVLQVCCSVLQCAACVALCCSAVQRVAVCGGNSFWPWGGHD